MTIIELGALASGLLAVITLISKIIQLITTIQSLITSIEQLQKDMKTGKEHWAAMAEKHVKLDQRVSQIEYKLTPV